MSFHDFCGCHLRFWRAGAWCGRRQWRIKGIYNFEQLDQAIEDSAAEVSERCDLSTTMPHVIDDMLADTDKRSLLGLLLGQHHPPFGVYDWVDVTKQTVLKGGGSSGTQDFNVFATTSPLRSLHSMGSGLSCVDFRNTVWNTLMGYSTTSHRAPAAIATVTFSDEFHLAVCQVEAPEEHDQSHDLVRHWSG